MTHNADKLRTIVIDNQDSFVYNLVDMLVADAYDVRVYRNTIDAQRVVDEAVGLGASICLSPGPGEPHRAGNMMRIIELAGKKRIPVVGICLGFQALLGVAGGHVERVGPVHGVANAMRITEEGQAVFGPGPTTPVARYHSLGVRNTVPQGWHAWGWVDNIVMAGCNPQLKQAGFQFHPESILTPGGVSFIRKTLAIIGQADAVCA